MRTVSLGLLGILLTGAVWAASPLDFPGGFRPLNGQAMAVHMREVTQGSMWDTCVGLDGTASVVLGGGMSVELPRTTLTSAQLSQFMSDADRLGFFKLPEHPTVKTDPRYLVFLSIVNGDKHAEVGGYGPADPCIRALHDELVGLIPPPPVPDRADHF